MAQTQSRIFDRAAKKMFIKMFAEDDILETLGNEDLVWIEGIIRNVQPQMDTFILDDATGTTKVDYSNPRRLRSFNKELVKVNSTVMVVGKIEAFPPDSLVRALRLSPIPNCEVHVCMWEMEVMHQHREVNRARYDRRMKEEGDPMAHYPMGY